MPTEEKALSAFKALSMYEAEVKEQQISKPDDHSVIQIIEEQKTPEPASFE